MHKYILSYTITLNHSFSITPTHDVRSLETLMSIGLKHLYHQLTCLCALTMGQQAQTLSVFDETNTKLVTGPAIIQMTKLIKIPRIGKPQPVVLRQPISMAKLLVLSPHS